MIGSTLGPYRLLGLAGRGGMGEVYLAEDSRLGRTVALKMLPADARADSDRVNRFRREARALASLNHPGIVTIHSVEEAEGIPFLTMELVGGTTLTDCIVPGGLPSAEFMDLALQITEALAAAHDSGVIHRDLKPGNVMRTPAGRIKILDFGLARRSLVIPGSPQTALPTEAMTQDGSILGTLAYMAPEQLQGRPADLASDVFSLGVLLQEMATGRHPFAGSTGPEIMTAILRDDPPDLAGLRPDLPKGVVETIRRCLARVPEARPRTAREVYEILTRAGIAEAAEFAEGRSTVAKDREVLASAPRNAVAVVNFENVTRDPEAEWLATGIAETMASDLRKIASLAVLSRDRVIEAHARAAGAQSPLVETGKRLGARWVVSGSFQKLGHAVRITATTLEVDTGTVLESAKVDGVMDQIFALQDHLVAALLDGFRIGPSDTEKQKLERPQTLDLEAYEYYAKGRMRVFRMGPDSLREAEGFLRKAVERDPGYALAYSGLGQTFAMRFIGTTDPRDLLTAIDHLERAAALDAELADPHIWLTYSLSRLHRNDEALRSGARGVELEPENPNAWYMLGLARLLAAFDAPDAGLSDLAIAAFHRTKLLAPRYTFTHGNLASLLLAQGRVDEARSVLEEAVAIEATGDYELARFVGSQALLGNVELRAGRLESAARRLDLALASFEGVEHVYRHQLCAFARTCRGELSVRQGRMDDALAEFREALALCDAHPRFLGMGRVRVRTLLGQARAFLRLHMRREAQAAVESVRGFLDDPAGWDMNWIWGNSDPELHELLAGTLALVGERETAWAALEQAYERGWSDAEWIEMDPALAPLRDDPRFKELTQRVRARLTPRT